MPSVPRCVRCQSLLDLSTVAVEPPRAGRVAWLWHRPAVPIRRTVACMTALLGSMASVLPQQRTRVARVALLDLLLCAVPGATHLRQGKRRVGAALLALWLNLLLVASLWVLSGLAILAYAAAVGVHALAIALILRSTIWWRSRMRRLATGVLVVVLLHVCLYGPARTAIGWAASPMRLSVLGTPDTPMLSPGDVVLYRAWSDPAAYERGEIVAYRVRPGGADGYMVRTGYGFERIVGLPGDHVAVDASRLRVNGQAVPDARQPLGAIDAMPELSFTVAADRYAIVPSMMDWDVSSAAVESRRAALAVNTAHVHRRDILGPVWWRLRPFRRFGPVE
ncbi:MAG: S26 family signal peptidase [Phycisphaeraceae bacterium]